MLCGCDGNAKRQCGSVMPRMMRRVGSWCSEKKGTTSGTLGGGCQLRFFGSKTFKINLRGGREGGWLSILFSMCSKAS